MNTVLQRATSMTCIGNGNGNGNDSTTTTTTTTTIPKQQQQQQQQEVDGVPFYQKTTSRIAFLVYAIALTVSFFVAVTTTTITTT